MFLYLGGGLRLVDGVPFGKQTPPTRKVITLAMTLGYGVAVGIAIGIQYILFHSVAAVIVATLVAGLGARILTRKALADFESRIRFNLSPSAAASEFR